ncbi:MAG: MBL fold metallo-hydrolase [Candidatus Rokubacteria bacterium]|nr:MBL fold metallo-hydrolase [Candidatus Rokubacteria bacterium]
MSAGGAKRPNRHPKSSTFKRDGESAGGAKRPNRHPTSSTFKRDGESARGAKRPNRHPESSTFKRDGRTGHLTFLGAAGTVTGSKHLLEAGGARLLLDCGLFQGLKELRLRNWQPPPVDPARLGAVLLSHAHIDHAGYLPRLVRSGFTGPVFCTRGTADLLAVMLPDAASLQEEEAAFANRHKTSRHAPALPLFTTEDARRALQLIRTVQFGEPFQPARPVRARFLPAGHILGAGLVEVSAGGRVVVFSGDLGRYTVPILRDPDPVAEADVLLVESTYGDRLHPDGDRAAGIAEAVERATRHRGWLLVPAFAVGRSQELLYTLRELEEAGRIPSLPVYLDSPMAIEATAIYARHPEEHDTALRGAEAAGKRPFAPRRFHLARSVEDSKRLNAVDGPGIIIAGSGMATGGRILHHLRRLLPAPATTVLFVGYQAAGTRGRLLRDGVREVKLLGEMVPVRATILTSDAYSAHADRSEILRWLGGFRRPPAMTYVVHGEPEAAEALREAIRRERGWTVEVARDGQRVPLP